MITYQTDQGQWWVKLPPYIIITQLLGTTTFPETILGPWSDVPVIIDTWKDKKCEYILLEHNSIWLHSILIQRSLVEKNKEWVKEADSSLYQRPNLNPIEQFDYKNGSWQAKRPAWAKFLRK